MDEEIDDERKARISQYGLGDSYTVRRLKHELGSRLDTHVEAEALIEATRQGQVTSIFFFFFFVKCCFYKFIMNNANKSLFIVHLRSAGSGTGKKSHIFMHHPSAYLYITRSSVCYSIQLCCLPHLILFP